MYTLTSGSEQQDQPSWPYKHSHWPDTWSSQSAWAWHRPWTQWLPAPLYRASPSTHWTSRGSSPPAHIGKWDSNTRKSLVFNPQLHHLTRWPYAHHLTKLSLSFHICKMGLVTLNSEACERIKWDNAHKAGHVGLRKRWLPLQRLWEGPRAAKDPQPGFVVEDIQQWYCLHNKSSSWWLSNKHYYVPGTILSTLHQLSHLNLTPVLCGRCCHHSPLADEKTETYRG